MCHVPIDTYVDIHHDKMTIVVDHSEPINSIMCYVVDIHARIGNSIGGHRSGVYPHHCSIVHPSNDFFTTTRAGKAELGY